MAENKNEQPEIMEVKVEEETPPKEGGTEANQAELEETSGEEVESLDVEALQEELAASRAKADEYLDGWQRARAEFANYKKRIEREREQSQKLTAGNVIRRYLEVVDDLERALKDRPQEGDGAVWAGGIELIYRKLLNFLELEGVKPMRAESKEPFDPNLHEAITHEDNPEYESGAIIEVVQPGYMLGDHVLRPARVRVAK